MEAAAARLAVRRSPAGALGALMLLAVALRFGTLGAKSFWGDEVNTVDLVHRSFGHMLTGIGNLESTPPLYYAISWAWVRLVPSTEVGMRAIPALCGVLLVPVAYLIAKELASSRTATIAAALVACNPFLIWYSQEARSYSLLALLSAVGLLLFLRLLKQPRARLYVAWTVVTALALATHYFAAFLAVPEAAILVRSAQRRLAPAMAVGIVALTAVPMLALALHQASLGHANWIGNAPLLGRLAVTPAQFMVGFDLTTVALPAAGVALAAGLAGATMLARSDRVGSGTRIVLMLVGTAVAIPAGLASLGLDYLDPRNLIGALVPFLILLAIGFASTSRPRLGTAAAATMCAASLAIVLVTAGEPKYHSEDWRAAASDLGPPAVSRLVVAVPGNFARKPMEFYLRGSAQLAASGDPVREIDELALPHQGSTEPASAPPLASPRLRLVGRDFDGRFAVWRYRPASTLWITPTELAPLLGNRRPALIYQASPSQPQPARFLAPAG